MTMTRQERLKRLARSLDRMAEADLKRVQEAQRIAVLRREAAAGLHAICAEFVSSVNALAGRPALDLAPAEYSPQAFQEGGANLVQINASGRVVQITFHATANLETTENYRTPYILEGAVRWFNQELLDEQEIEEHMLFYCLDRRANQWIYFDAPMHRGGAVDIDYLAGLFEQLL